MAKTPPKWITTKEAAEISGYHLTHMSWLIRKGHIKAHKFGNVWQVDRSSLAAYRRKVKKSGEKRGPKSAS
ncbi:MAG: helix-turn-helix domain-containing protein [Chloroflexi bacterium]|nr:helix-turn-helix domain-containing protein [Chloroflexota bacterium]